MKDKDTDIKHSISKICATVKRSFYIFIYATLTSKDRIIIE